MHGVAFEFRAGALTLITRDTITGEGEDEIPIACDEELRIGFNGRNLCDALDHMDRDDVEFVGGTGTRPVKLTCVGDTNNYMMLGLMRMKWAFGE